VNIKKEKKLKKYFDLFLVDFIPNDKPTVIWDSFGNSGAKTLRQHYVKIPKELRIRDPYIVFIIFVNLKGFPFSGAWEKVAWEIPIKFKNEEFILSHRKFGFEIVALEDCVKTNELAIEAIKLIRKAIPYTESLIEPLVKEKVNNREVTINNEFPTLKRRYNYLRKKAEAEYKRDYKELKIETIDGLDEYLTETEKYVYYTSAMLDAFFSLVEHVFVGLIPFLRDKNIKSLKVEEYILSNWKEKYKYVFNLSEDKEANKQLEKLLFIKEQFRNPLSHGNYLKDGSSLKIHMEYVGAIPMKLTQANKNLHYSFKGLNNLSFETICETLDLFISYLTTNERTKFGMMYLNSELPIFLNKEMRTKNLRAMRSENAFRNHMNRLEKMINDHRNMDW
jgi:hypothetical protein